MKLPIKKEFFDQIKSGEKTIEFRDAHITFVCEETGETLTREVTDVKILSRYAMPEKLRNSDIFTDNWQIWFYLKKGEEK